MAKQDKNKKLERVTRQSTKIVLKTTKPTANRNHSERDKKQQAKLASLKHISQKSKRINKIPRNSSKLSGGDENPKVTEGIKPKKMLTKKNDVRKISTSVRGKNTQNPDSKDNVLKKKKQ